MALTYSSYESFKTAAKTSDLSVIVRVSTSASSRSTPTATSYKTGGTTGVTSQGIGATPLRGIQTKTTNSR